MAALLVTLAVASAFLVWPVHRWVVRGDGPLYQYGFAANLAAALLALGFAIVAHEPVPDFSTWVIAAGAGAALAAGYWIVILRALRIGPTAPTIALNSMGLIWPVVIGAGVLEPRPLGPLSSAGIALVLLAVGVLATGEIAKGTATGGTATRDWLSLGIGGWVLSGVALTLLMAAQIRFPMSAGFVVCAHAAAAALCLAPLAISDARNVRPREAAGGLAAGGILLINSVTVLAALRAASPELVTTLPTVVPIALMLLLGHALYGEKLTWRAWVASLLAAGGVAALSAGVAGL